MSDLVCIEPIDLDAVCGDARRPLVVEGRVIETTRRIEDSPLYGKTLLDGHMVTDPAEIDRMAVRIAWHRLPWWKRIGRRQLSRAGTATQRRAVAEVQR